MEIVFVAVALGIGYILSMLSRQFTIKLFLFSFLPLLSIILLFPIPNGTTVLKIMIRYITYKINQQKYKKYNELQVTK